MRGKREFDIADLLAAVPVPNHEVRSDEPNDEELRLRVPLRQRWFMRWPFSWVFPFSREKVVQLDVLGREVWSACDGEQSMEQIIEDFADRHGVSFHEARLSVSQFMHELMQRGFLVLVGSPKQEAEA